MITRILTGLLVFFLATTSPACAQEATTWPAFRGQGDSHTAAQHLPKSWEPRGRAPGNWTIRLPGYGQSSPVVWHDVVFVTSVSGEEKEHLHVLAVSLEDGKTLWQRDFAGTQRVKDSDTVSRGAPTPAVDGERLYAVFESGDVFALSHAGELQWQRSFVKEHGEIKGPHGYASSPVLVDDLCVIQVSHSGPSYVLALDRVTGNERWRTEHPSQTGWSTPAVLREKSGSQIIVSTSGSIRALDARTGAEIWIDSEIQGNSTASPTIAGKYLVIGASAESSGGGRGGAGKGGTDRDTAKTKPTTGSMVRHWPATDRRVAPRLAWKSTKVSSGYASPVVVNGLAYFVNRVGAVQCVDLASGEVHWQHRLPGEVWASPVANNGQITFFCKYGQVVTLQGRAKLVEVAESQVSTTDVVYGVAAVEGTWIVRTGRGLIRISDRPAASDGPQSR